MKAFLFFKSHTRVWFHAVVVGNSIILLLFHVLEENFSLCFFSSVTVFSPSSFTSMFFCISCLKVSCSDMWSLPSIFSSFLHPHDSFTIFLVAPMLLLLYGLDSFLPSSFLPVLHVFYALCSSSSSYFMLRFTSMSSQHTWVCIPFIPGSLQTFLTALLASWCSRWPSLLITIKIC